MGPCFKNSPEVAFFCSLEREESKPISQRPQKISWDRKMSQVNTGKEKNGRKIENYKYEGHNEKDKRKTSSLMMQWQTWKITKKREQNRM